MVEGNDMQIKLIETCNNGSSYVLRPTSYGALKRLGYGLMVVDGGPKHGG